MLEKPADEEPPKADFKADIIATFSLLISKKMLLMVPFLAWNALSLALYSGSFVRLITDTMDQSWDENKQNMYGMLTMICLGVGEILGSVL